MRVAAFVVCLIVSTNLLQAQGNSPAPALIPFSEKSISEVRSRHKGKVLIVNFWATWCKPCLEEFPDLLKIREQYSRKGVEVVFVSIDDDARAKQKVSSFLRKMKVTFPTYIKETSDDESFINSIYTEWSGALPATFIYDRKGDLRKAKIEETSFSELESIIKPLL